MRDLRVFSWRRWGVVVETSSQVGLLDFFSHLPKLSVGVVDAFDLQASAGRTFEATRVAVMFPSARFFFLNSLLHSGVKWATVGLSCTYLRIRSEAFISTHRKVHAHNTHTHIHTHTFSQMDRYRQIYEPVARTAYQTQGWRRWMRWKGEATCAWCQVGVPCDARWCTGQGRH